ncbi:MAG: hypothetical protein R3Y60_02015 [bacterium]
MKKFRLSENEAIFNKYEEFLFEDHDTTNTKLFDTLEEAKEYFNLNKKRKIEKQPYGKVKVSNTVLELLTYDDEDVTETDHIEDYSFTNIEEYNDFISEKVKTELSNRLDYETTFVLLGHLDEDLFIDVMDYQDVILGCFDVDNKFSLELAIDTLMYCFDAIDRDDLFKTNDLKLINTYIVLEKLDDRIY